MKTKTRYCITCFDLKSKSFKWNYTPLPRCITLFFKLTQKTARAHNISLNSRCFWRELFRYTFHARKTYHFSKSRPRKGKTNENAELIQILYTNVPYIEPYITHFVYCRYCASWIRLISTRIILRETFAPNWPFSNIYKVKDRDFS